MMIHEITQLVGRHKRKKRIGRGQGSGTGKTSGRGHKGAGSRSGFSGSIHPAYQGGAMPYFRRIAKRGFNNANFTTRYAVVNLADLDRQFENGATVDGEALAKAGLIRHAADPVKILGTGELTKKLTIKATKVSASALQKIESAGGSITTAEAV